MHRHHRAGSCSSIRRVAEARKVCRWPFSSVMEIEIRAWNSNKPSNPLLQLPPVRGGSCEKHVKVSPIPSACQDSANCFAQMAKTSYSKTGSFMVASYAGSTFGSFFKCRTGGNTAASDVGNLLVSSSKCRASWDVTTSERSSFISREAMSRCGSPAGCTVTLRTRFSAGAERLCAWHRLWPLYPGHIPGCQIAPKALRLLQMSHTDHSPGRSISPKAPCLWLFETELWSPVVTAVGFLSWHFLSWL